MRNNPVVACVDDDRASLNMLGQLLRDEGYTVHLFSDPLEALEGLKSLVVDLLILDVMMPKMDGCELYAALRSLPRFQDAHVIFLTASFIQNGELCGQKGLNVLRKPLDIDLLLETMETLLDL
jgi:CheY-like chemotaxis protein